MCKSKLIMMDYAVANGNEDCISNNYIKVANDFFN